MTGLDPESCVIVQAAMILTDVKLNEISEPFEMTVWQPESALETMGPYVRNMHTNSGLLNQIRDSRKTLDECEREMMKILTEHCAYKRGFIAGNSIGQDRKFIDRYMPQLSGYLHYRQIDVSSVKELAEWWYEAKFEKSDEGKHTALADIRNSIEELRYYRSKVFKEQP